MLWLTETVEELRLGARRLAREPVLTGTAVMTLAVGTGIVAAVFALVDGVLLRPLPYPDSGNLVAVHHTAPGIELDRDGVSAGVFLHYRDNNRVFDGFAAWDVTAHTITDAGLAERVRSAAVTPELFDVLRVVALIGRVPTATDYAHDMTSGQGPMGALIAHELWVRRYGADPDVVGRTLEIDGEPWATVTGVAPSGFAFPDSDTEVWLAVPQEALSWSRRAEVRHAMTMKGIARLRAGVSPREAEADLNRLVHLLPDAFPDISAAEIERYGLRAHVAPFRDVVVGDVRLTLLLLLASSGFLLLVTWANVANLLLARAHGRRVEIGITRALGATEGNIARRLFSESLLLTLTGGAAGLLLAWLALGSAVGAAAIQLPRLDEVGINGGVIGLVAVLALTSGAAMGIICVTATRQRVAGPSLSALRSRSTTQGRDGQTGRSLLVASQLAIALTLLVGSGLMARTYRGLQSADLGFQPADRLSFYVPVTHLGRDAGHHEFAAVYDQLTRRLAGLPGVDAVEAATTSVFPLTLPEAGHEPTAIAPAGADPAAADGWPLAQYGYATAGYFDAIGIPLVAGRTFHPGDAAVGASGVIISQSLARDLFGSDEPVGRSVEFIDWRSFWASTHTVVGVVGDVPATTKRAGGSRAIYLPHVFPLAADVTVESLYPYVPRFETYVLRTGRDPASLAAEIRRAIHGVDPRLSMLDLASLDAIVADATAQERFTLLLLLVSAGAALFLASVGVYGVLAYSVRRRTAEIGLRLALGASPAQVTRLVVTQGALLSACGIAAGLVGALALTRFIAALLYGTSTTDPVTFTATTLLLFIVALGASYIPARRASRIDPSHALRAE